MPAVAILESRRSGPLREWTARVARTLSRLARGAATTICSHQRQYITVARLDGPTPTALDAMAPDARLAFVMVDSLDAFHAVMQEIPATFRDSLDDLAR